MKTLTNKLNILSLTAILFVVFVISFASFGITADAYDGGYYGSGYDSGYYGSYYDSGYGSYYDSGYGSYYDSGYGSYYGSGYDSYYGGYDSYYGGYDDYYCYDCGDYYYDDYCYDCYVPTCDTCYVPPVTPNVVVSCSANDNNLKTGESVTWTANASGGNGSFSYSWSGTDGLSGSGRQIYKTYNSTGSKNAHVTVTSGGKTASADCGTVYVEEEEESLTGSCEVDDSSVEVDDYVEWSAEASGGTGSYSYEWSGTSPLSGKTGSHVSVRYTSDGTKHGTVTIRSGDKSITRSCGTVVVEDEEEDNEDLDLYCTVNNANLSIGQGAYWKVEADGGDGSYRYSWSGTDNLSGKNSSISKSYNTIGTKYATVRVTSDGESESINCPVVVVGAMAYPNPGTPASLSSVYLNQVPYTGVGDNPKFVAFIIGLFMFSALGAYMIVSKRAKTERKNKILDFKHENMIKRGIK